MIMNSKTNHLINNSINEGDLPNSETAPLNFMFLDLFLFELSCKNTHTHTHTHTHQGLSCRTREDFYISLLMRGLGLPIGESIPTFELYMLE